MASLRRARPPEGTENESDAPVPLPPPRTPLISIPDPSQNPREALAGELEVPTADHSQLWAKGTGGTPRSAQSTPTRSLSRVHCGNGGLGSGNGGRLPLHAGPRERGSSSRAVRALADVNPCPSAEIHHFELDEDPSFWNDHNVQVLIRVRPLDNAESALQGHGRCLRQESSRTLTWTGHPETRFTFDHIACETMSQATLFKAVGVPMVENCMSGYNSCMFAYGQTGSGKTYTMMGEIWEMDNNISEDRGMTPRIFEYLFAKIREEEENRKNEKLKYSCKCSYLEIYNEQITDLLDPSSTNLLLREDVKKGVYVENLKEHDVNTVRDVIELLLQGTANQKIAATSMNSESSRSHGVFTCRIESHWEKDSMVHIRFGRLNLVDLAGSERQKSSGAEGERLKEAANINRSLSILGLVIMTLVDIANGKHRHVPYRDSRLTFLLQDSLGGNSKTTIIANVSPSMCSANETLSTLKFAQRAKLIQNNAKVNEDASGDVMALQREIQRLREQLNIVAEHQNVHTPLFGSSGAYEIASVDNILDKCDSYTGGHTASLKSSSFVDSKMKYLRSALASSLRREKMAEAQFRDLEAENEHMKRLVHEMEADTQRSKMLLHLRDETIRRLELLADGLVSGNEYFMEKNNALNEELQLLRDKLDKNPELTRFALENIKLLEQLRVFQDFYQQGEREILLDEISQLRNEFLDVLDGMYDKVKLTFGRENQVDIALTQDVTPFIQQRNPHIQRVVDCSNKCVDSQQINDCFTGEVDDLHCQAKYQSPTCQSISHTVTDCLCRESQWMPEAGPLPVELMLVENGLGDRIASLVKLDEVTSHRDTDEISECGGTRKSSSVKLDEVTSHRDTDEISECGGTRKSSSHTKLGKVQKEFEESQNLNLQLENEHCSRLCQFSEMEQIREQVEMEAARAILNLQQELAVLQQEVSSRHASDSIDEAPSALLRTENQELKVRLCQITKENAELLDLINVNDAQTNMVSEEWEKAVIDLTSFLVDGCQFLEDASDQIHSIVNSFPQRKTWISDHVERAMKVFIEKERLIINLRRSLEDAQRMGLEMTSKLNSLKGATLAMTEVQQLENDETTNELLYLQTLLNKKMLKIQELEDDVKCKHDKIVKAEKQANAAFIAIKRLNETALIRPFHARVDKLMINRAEIVHPHLQSRQGRDCKYARDELQVPFEDPWNEQTEDRIPESKLLLSVDRERVITTEEINLKEDVFSLKDIHDHIEMGELRVWEFDNELFACYTDTQNYLASLIADINDTYTASKSFIHQFIAEIYNMKKYFMELVNWHMHFSVGMVESLVSEAQCWKLRGPYSMMQLIKDDLTKANERLIALKVFIERLFDRYGNVVEHESFSQNDLIVMLREEGKLWLNATEILHLREELDLSFHDLSTIHDQLTVLLDDIKDTKSCSRGNCSSEEAKVGTNILSINDFSQLENTCHVLQVLEQRIEETDANCSRTRDMLHLRLNDARRVADDKTNRAANLFLKFEEFLKTMKEADLMLNELLRAKEAARLETDMWKQASQVMQMETASLAAEVEQMKNDIAVDIEWNQTLSNQINETASEMPNLMCELEEMFQMMQSYTKSELKVVRSDIFSFAREMREFMRMSKVCFDALFSEIIRKDSPLSMPNSQNIGFLHEVTSSCMGPVPVSSCNIQSSSVLRDSGKDFLNIRNSLGSIREGSGEKTERQPKCELSGLGENWELPNTFQGSFVDDVSNLDSANCESWDGLNSLKHTDFRMGKLETEKTGLINDFKLVKGATSNKVMRFEQFNNFIKKLSLQDQVSRCRSAHLGNECTPANTLADQSETCDTSISFGTFDSAMYAVPKPQSYIADDSTMGVATDEDAVRQDEVAVARTEVYTFLISIQSLKAQCAKLIILEMEKKNCSQLTFPCNNTIDTSMHMFVHEEVKPMDSIETNKGHANQLMPGLDELGNSLAWLTSWLHSDLDAEMGTDVFPSLLEILFQGICNLEETANKFLERDLRNTIEQNDNVTDSSSKRELDWKDVLLGSVCCEQVPKESISTNKDIKAGAEEITAALSQVQHELAIKMAEVDVILHYQRDLESQLADSEAALSSTRFELKETKDALNILSRENNKLLLLLEDANRKHMDAEEQLKEQEKVIENLEKEILCMSTSLEAKIFSSVEETLEELRLTNDERDQLQKEVVHLNENLEMASALADENEAVAIEAHQDAEASKLYAEQKEEEIKVLESSVEELESTINVLEKKVYDMGEEVEKYRLITEDLEQELHTLRERLFIGVCASENFDTEDSVFGVQQLPRQINDIFLELSVAKRHIKDLEKERACQAEEIEQYRDHISEIILHSEAQSSLYQQKFQTLEAMVQDTKIFPSAFNHDSSVTNKTDKSLLRPRGSGSPFRCISSLVQQMSSEKDQELSVAKLRIEELESQAANRQKQVCLLSARLAAVDNMTHDVIKDLLEVKLDMTKYANLIEVKELHKLIENDCQQHDENRAKDEEILKLKAQISALIEEKDSWIEEMKADVLSSQAKLEKLHQRDQLLTAQNEMLKMDKVNLTGKIAELDEMIKKLVGSQSIQELIQTQNVKESNFSRHNNKELAKRLAASDKLLTRARNELAWCHTSNSSEPFVQHQ